MTDGTATHPHPPVAVIGGGPAGLMAAEMLLERGHKVVLFDAMASVGRKFLMAGKSGLNVTRAEDLPAFLGHFGQARAALEEALSAFPPDAVRGFCQGLGIETFVGTTGRVFPTDYKAAPLLRAWLRRLRAGGLQTRVRHRWTGWAADGALAFDTPNGPVTFAPSATILALGGASWPKLGSDGAWVGPLSERGLSVAPLRPANCGFDVAWSEHFLSRFCGQPVKAVRLSFKGETHGGEFVVTQNGVEGGGIYTFSAALRDHMEAHGSADLMLDLAPDRSQDQLAQALATPRGKRSLAWQLKRRAGIEGVKAGLLREGLADPTVLDHPAALAKRIKALPLRLLRPRPIEEAISSAGGLMLDQLQGWQLPGLPGTFAAGEMLDWEAPTGGYLITACLATGRAAGLAAAAWVEFKNGVLG